jgi:(2Fe-2S) ferredoxin
MPRPKLQHHVFVCVNRRPPGHPKGSCGARGAIEVLQALQQARMDHELFDTVRVSSSSCLGPCEHGANVVVYPDDVWYGGVQAQDVDDIVEQHLVGGQPVERLKIPE